MKSFQISLIFLAAVMLSGCVTLAITGGTALAMSLNDRRTLGTQIDDQSLESKAFQAYTSVKNAESQSSLSFTAFNGTLLVTGQSQSQQILNQVIAALKPLPSLKAIQNEVEIIAESSSLTTVSDAALTTKIKTKLTFAKDINSNHVKVVSENGEVFLMGLVSKQEADKIIDVVRRVDGVQKVIELFEII
jgi:osmotically-inducible protein OsmY